MKFLALLFGNNIWIFYSYIIKLILIARGFKIGKKFLIKGVPILKISGKSKNIVIGDNVVIAGDIDIRNRENGKLIIGDNVFIDHDCRFVAAREGAIVLHNNVALGPYISMNGGGSIIIKKDSMFSGRNVLNANEHLSVKDELIKSQGYMHKDIVVEEDCFIGANVGINKGVVIRKGSIVGVNAVVTQDTLEYSINAGIPSKKISERV